MCGIFGFFHLDTAQKAQGSLLVPMGGTLEHRGPDDSGSHIERYMALGHRRLSILDLSPNGRQPMANEDGTLWLVFNGEIYNFRDWVPALKSKGHMFRSGTDCEVILHLYEEEGIGFLEKIEGMFSFVLWDKKTDEVFLVRDRMGIKPLHYAETKNQIIFASEIKALLKHPDVSRTLDLKSLSEYLSFEYVPAPRSIFTGIRKVMPGHYVHVKKGVVRRVCYWDLAALETGKEKTEAEYAEELGRLLAASVKRQMIADVPVGAFLSGGIDSTSICALMRDASPGRVKSFNISFEDKSFDESIYAKHAADFLGIDHEVEKLSPGKMQALIPQVMDFLDEPFGDASFFPTLLLSRFTRRHVKVSLSGDGSDELFGGYPTYPAHRWALAYGRIPAGIRSAWEALVRRLPVSHRDLSFDFKLKKFISAAPVLSPARRNYLWLGSFANEEKRSLLKPEVSKSLEGHDAFEVAEYHYMRHSSKDMLEKILFCDQRFYLQDNMLVKIDRASMAASLEARVPFLDRSVVEFAARLPVRLKVKGLTAKYLLKKTMAPVLPGKILRRTKKGFGIPLARWFCTDLKPFLLDIFSPARIKAGGLFRPESVTRLLEEHFEKKTDHRKKIYTLLNFELWREKYLA